MSKGWERFNFICIGFAVGVLVTKWRSGQPIDWDRMIDSVVWYYVGVVGTLLILMLIGWLFDRRYRRTR